MGSPAQQAAIKEHLQCAVCWEQITDSRRLACQHTFCLACLNRLFEQSPGRTLLVCPSCRRQAPVPAAGPVDLPKNPLVDELVKTTQLSRAGTQHLCEDCDDEATAAGYCVRCEMLLCDACVRAHNRSRTRRGHSILAIAMYKEIHSCQGPPSLPAENLECLVHDGEVMDIYCETCRQAVCFRCVAAQHDSCVTGNLDEICIRQKASTRKLIKRVEDKIINPLHSATEATKHHQQAMATSAAEAKAELGNVFEICQQLLEQRRQQLVSDIDQHHEAWSKCFERTLSHFTADLHRALQVTHAAKITLVSNKKAAVLSAIPATNAWLTDLEDTYSIPPLPTAQLISFSADATILHEMITNIGIVKPEHLAILRMPTVALQNFTSSFVVKSSVPTTPPIVQVQSLEDGPDGDVTVSKLEKSQGSFIVKLKTNAPGKHKVHVQVNRYEMESIAKDFEVKSMAIADKPRKIIGKKGVGDYQFNSPFGITMCGRHILVADRHNHRLQEFDSDGKLIRSFQTRGELAAAALHPSGVILATNFTHHCVQVFSRDGFTLYRFGSKGSQPGEFDNPKGIGVTSKGHVVVADAGNNRLQIIDVKGAPITQFSSCGPNRKLNWPLFLTVDTTEDHIFVSDYNSHRVEEFTKDGQHIRSIGHKCGQEMGKMNHPTGVALLPSNHLLVADYFNDRVCVFTREGVCVGLWGNIKDPRDVTCSDDGRVFVTQDVSHCVQFY